MRIADRAYIVCATPRSGSSLLCEALWNTCLAGRAEEYFNRRSESIWRARYGIRSDIGYFHWMIDHGTSSNGVFGAKIMWEHMVYCSQLFRQLPDHQHHRGNVSQLLSAALPNLAYIWIKRSDKVRQAVSVDLALQTGNYAWIGDQKPTRRTEPVFNFSRIDFQVYRILASELAWQRYFDEAEVTPFEVVYEDFVEHYDETTRAILRYLRIHVPAHQGFWARPKLRKMADAVNEEWAKRYQEIRMQQPAEAGRIRHRLAQWAASTSESYQRK